VLIFGVIGGEEMKISVKRLIRDEKGRVMILALILLAVGGITTTPLLAYMNTGLVTGEVYGMKTEELYAADSGVEDAVWKIQQGEAPVCPGNPTWSYNISDVNNKSMEVTITYVNNFTTSIAYKITSIATTDNDSSTTIDSYVERSLGGELDIFSGILSSKGDINFISHGSTVTGDIYYGGTLDPDFTHVSGNETQCDPVEDFPTQAQNVAFAQMLKEEAMAEDNIYDGNMNIDTDRPLGPIYITGNLYMSKDVTITIGGTVYVGGSVSTAKEYTLAGSGSLIAEGDITISKTSDFGTTGDCVIMSLNGDIGFKKDATIEALVYAPNGDISFDKNATVNGSIVGASITVKKDAALTYIEKASSFDLPGELPSRVEIKTYSINP
jgi:hypothetical protein